MAKTDFQSIDEYHSTLPAEIQARLQQVREIVHAIAPEAVEVISYQIPAFKIGKHFLLYYSAYTKHITLSSVWSPGFLEAFAGDLKGLKVTKSAIQLPNNQPLPVEFITRVVGFRRGEVGV